MIKLRIEKNVVAKITAVNFIKKFTRVNNIIVKVRLYANYVIKWSVKKCSVSFYSKWIDLNNG